MYYVNAGRNDTRERAISMNQPEPYSLMFIDYK